MFFWNSLAFSMIQWILAIWSLVPLPFLKPAWSWTPVLWPPHAKSWLIGKDSDVGRDWGQEEKGTTEDEMAGWHHRLDGCVFEWTPGVGDGQGGLGCCNSWGRKELDTTEWLNWTELNYAHAIIFSIVLAFLWSHRFFSYFLKYN